MIISCVKLLVNLKSMRLKVPTCKESLVTLVAKVIIRLCVCVIDMSPNVYSEDKYISILRTERGFLFYVNSTVTR